MWPFVTLVDSPIVELFFDCATTTHVVGLFDTLLPYSVPSRYFRGRLKDGVSRGLQFQWQGIWETESTRVDPCTNNMAPNNFKLLVFRSTNRKSKSPSNTVNLGEERFWTIRQTLRKTRDDLCNCIPQKILRNGPTSPVIYSCSFVPATRLIFKPRRRGRVAVMGFADGGGE